MRRLGAVAMAVALLWPGVSQAAPGAFAGAEQLALADWLDLKAKRFYFAMGIHYVGPEGAMTMGVVGRGICEVQKSKDFTIVSCFGRGQGRELSAEEFQFDPALGSASMTLDSGGYSHSVEWTGEDAPVAGTQTAGSSFGVQAGAGAARSAPASADLYGQKLKAGGRANFGVLSEAGYAVVYNEGRRVQVLDDGSVRMRVQYRIPR
jgi:hypothetical protein